MRKQKSWRESSISTEKDLVILEFASQEGRESKVIEWSSKFTKKSNLVEVGNEDDDRNSNDIKYM